MLIVDTVQKARRFAVVSLAVTGVGIYYAAWLNGIVSGFSGQGGIALVILGAGLLSVALIGFYLGREAVRHLKQDAGIFYWIAWLGKWLSLLVPVLFAVLVFAGVGT
jgi:hypothetical protein